MSIAAETDAIVLNQTQVPVGDFATVLYNHFRLPQPQDPRSEPLPDDASEQMLQMASGLQLDEYERRSPDCAQFVALERARRATASSDTGPSNLYGINSYGSISAYSSGGDWLADDELRKLLGLKSLFSNESDTVSLSNFGIICGCFAPFNAEMLDRVRLSLSLSLSLSRSSSRGTPPTARSSTLSFPTNLASV